VTIGAHDTEEAIDAIQTAHDDWARSSRDCGAKSEETITARTRFLEAIAA
jgi:hypothetical protein